MSGEGISAALDAGLLAAEHVHRSLCGRGSLREYGRQLDRRMPRISQNLSVMVRSIARLDESGGLDEARPRELNFLLSAGQMGADIEIFADPEASSLAAMMRRVDPAGAKLLREVNDKLLEDLSTTFPFAKPMISRELSEQGGPAYATTLICCFRSCGGEAGEKARFGAQASECLAPFAASISRLSDHPQAKLEKFNNALAILTADFAVSQSLVAVAEIGPGAAASLARTAQRVCEGGMMDATDRYRFDRPTSRYLRATELRVGSVFAFAAALGAELAGSAPASVEPFRRYGLMLGVAYRIAGDIGALDASDEEAQLALIHSLRNGKYGLPLLIAAERDLFVRRKLTAGVSSRDLPDLLAHIDRVGAIEEAWELAGICAGSARGALDEAAPHDSTDLDALLTWVEQPLADRR